MNERISENISPVLREKRQKSLFLVEGVPTYLFPVPTPLIAKSGIDPRSDAFFSVFEQGLDTNKLQFIKHLVDTQQISDYTLNSQYSLDETDSFFKLPY